MWLLFFSSFLVAHEIFVIAKGMAQILQPFLEIGHRNEYSLFLCCRLAEGYPGRDKYRLILYTIKNQYDEIKY